MASIRDKNSLKEIHRPLNLHLAFGTPYIICLPWILPCTSGSLFQESDNSDFCECVSERVSLPFAHKQANTSDKRLCHGWLMDNRSLERHQPPIELVHPAIDRREIPSLCGF